MSATPSYRRAALAGTATAVTLLGCLGLQTASATSYPWPGPPSDVHVAGQSTSSLVIAANKATHTARYEVWVSASMPDLYAANLNKKAQGRKSVSSSNPKLTVASLSYQAGPIYYRFANVNGPHRYLTKIRTTYLRPARPSPVAATSANGLALSWSSKPVTGYVVEQSNNPNFTDGLTSYTLHGLASQFTPYRVKPGHAYHFRVGAVNGNIHSRYSAPISATTKAFEPVTMVTYNVLSAAADGQTENGSTILSWLKYRKIAAVNLLRRADPDIIVVQEGGAYVRPRLRQVDSLRNTLGGHYTVAHTEPLPGSGPHVTSGSYVVYRNTRFAPVGDGRYLKLTAGKYDAFQVLRDKQTGARFEVCSIHMPAGSSATMNAERGTDASRTLAVANQISTADGGIPILFGGDTVSVLAPWHPLDAPGSVMRNAHIADAIVSAQSRSNEHYSSFNGLRRRVQSDGYPVDRIFVSPGVGVQSWTQLMNLTHGKMTGVIPSDHNPVVTHLLLPTVTGNS